MSFSNATWRVEQLISDVESGRLGLPEIQRPFIWDKKKVRDLLDSMKRDYPIGYLMLWQNSNQRNRPIGLPDSHQYATTQVIIDGQQRLTSLYAVMTGKEVLDENDSPETIDIAYNPLKDKFEVANPVLEKDPEWISKVSELFTKNAININNDFIAKLKKHREVSDDEVGLISKNISDVCNLKKFNLPVFDLKDVTLEEIAEIFVRVNSKGVSLKQHDFILTLLSLYWDDGRKAIEKFCSESRRPPAKRRAVTAYNQITEISAQNMVRVIMAYVFYRARLKYGYKFLCGSSFDKKDNDIDVAKRKERFDLLKEKVPNVLNADTWREFVAAIISAGYITKEMVSSKNVLFYSYAMYLIAKHKLKAETKENARLTALWFFYASLLGIYSSSPESTMDGHLNEIKDFTELDQYKQFIFKKLDERLTDDYFTRTLIGSDGLEASGSSNNAWNAYLAALNILGAKVLFSDSGLLLSKMFEPHMGGNKNPVEKHHLFPKAYLKKAKKLDNKAVDQMANYAYIEWKDNINISDVAPSEYYPQVCANMTEREIQAMEKENALPSGWEKMDYGTFLKARRKLMAEKIKEAYVILRKNVEKSVNSKGSRK